MRRARLRGRPRQGTGLPLGVTHPYLAADLRQRGALCTIHHLSKKPTPLKPAAAKVATRRTPEGKARHTDLSRTSTR